MYEVLNSSWIHRILSETFKTVLPNIYLSLLRKLFQFELSREYDESSTTIDVVLERIYMRKTWWVLSMEVTIWKLKLNE